MAKNEDWIRMGYKYCEKHDQHYRRACLDCSLDRNPSEHCPDCLTRTGNNQLCTSCADNQQIESRRNQ